MYRYSNRSKNNLSQCHPDLISLFNEVIKHVDCTILCGHRGREEQEEEFRSGSSKLRFGESLHNSMPSLAVDAAPYPIDWDDRERFAYFAGVVKGIAIMMGIKIRWGGDWDQDCTTVDESFSDMPHFEVLLR